MKILKFDSFNKFSVFKAINEKEQVDLDDAMKEAKKHVERCVTRVLGLFPFFGEFIYGARFIYTRSVDTMATDSYNYFINPEWTNKLNDRQIIFVLCHEVLHVAFLHNSRMFEHIPNINTKTADDWNIAGDYEINTHLVNVTGNELGLKAEDVKGAPLHGLFNDKYTPMSVEQIYDIIAKGGEDKDDDDKDSQNTPVEPKIGDYVQLKSGELGKIEAKNADGSFSIKEVSKQDVDDYFEKIKSSGIF